MFRQMYFLLFKRITDTIDALRRGESEEARTILICAQQEAEELYIEGKEE